MFPVVRLILDLRTVWSPPFIHFPFIEYCKKVQNASFDNVSVKKSHPQPDGFFRYFCVRYSKISAALVSGFTLGITFSTRPSWSRMKVERTTPMETFP